MPKARLVELYAHGLGVIDDAHLEFGPGFNVITGETGAGKTLLLGALDLCLGGDAGVSRYALSDDTRAVALFVRDERDEVALSREMSTSGRLRSSVGGIPSSVDALRALATALVVIHGQHDSLALRNRTEILRLIDASGDVDTAELDEVRRRLRETRGLLEDLGGDEGARLREIDVTAFQLNEIEGVSILSIHELRDALSELTRLSDLQRGEEALHEVLDTFDAESDDAVLSQFARALARLPESDAYDKGRRALSSSLTEAREALHELAQLADPDAFDAHVLEGLELRVNVLQQIARKYGGSLETALITRDELRTRLERMNADAERVGRLDQEVLELEDRAVSCASQVRREREVAAGSLTLAVQRQFERVALANATLRFDVEGEDGAEVQILFTPNPGRPEGPLASLASGGELSRVLLAISLETANEDVVAVFDEIDAGLGGQVAQQIGECLYEVGRRQQVLAVTHLASVAARADHHFVIEKNFDHEVTRTVVRTLHGSEREVEIARMLVGNDVTKESIALAQQLLENSTQVRLDSDI